MKSRRKSATLAFIFGVVFVCVILAIALFVPRPSNFQYAVFRIVLALAAAGIAAEIPGILKVKIHKVIQGSGALGVFLVVYFYSPANLVVQPGTFEKSRMTERTFHDILRLFEKEIGYPSRRSKGFSPEEYARRVTAFADKHSLSEDEREALRQKIAAKLEGEETSDPELDQSEQKPSWRSKAIFANPGEPGAPTNIPTNVATPIGTNDSAEPPKNEPRAFHGASIQLVILGDNGARRLTASVGETVLLLTRVRNLDDFGDSLIVTNISLNVHVGTGSPRSGNLLSAPVILRNLGDSFSVTNSFRVPDGAGTNILIDALGFGTDRHDGVDGNLLEQGFFVTFPAVLRVQ